MEEERAKREVRKENSQESSQANLFQARELMKVAEPEIDSLKTICACVSLGKSYANPPLPRPPPKGIHAPVCRLLI